MLTYPSDSLPQIVCPMDEHAIPPNSFCSAPPHSEPPPPLLPLSSVTPSCAKNGISGHRRSGRIQEIRAQTPKKQSNKDDRAAQTPSRQNPSPSKRQRESVNMVQVSQSKLPRAEGAHVHDKQNKDGFDLTLAAEHQNEQTDQKSPQKKPNTSAAENVVEEFAVDTTQNLDTTKSDMDMCRGLAVGHSFENASAPKGWVIGPLFQSFKSKMASFTEIVMSPVKLFRANSPPPCTDHPHKLDEYELLADGVSDVEHSGPSNTFHPEAQSENGNQDSRANQQEEAVALKYSKRLLFDVELPTCSSDQKDECAITQKEKNSTDSVPLHSRPSPCLVSRDISESVIKSSTLLQPSVDVSASHESKLKMSGAMEEQKGKLTVWLKPLPRKCTVTRSGVKKVTSRPEVKKEECELSDEQFSHMKSNKADSVCHAQSDTDCPQPDDDKKIESLVRPSHQNDISDSAKGTTLRPSLDAQQLNSEIYSATSLVKAKRRVELDCHAQDFVKRKRLTADTCTRYTKRQELLNVASDSGTLRPPRREVVSTNPIVDKEETLKPAHKRPSVSTRASKKGKGGQEMQSVLNTQREISSDAMLVCSVDKSSDVSENNEKGSSSKTKPKRLKTTSGVCKPDVNLDNNSMDQAITTTKQAKPELLSQVLTRPAIKPLQSTSKHRNINKKPLKRKTPIQSTTELDSALLSTSSVLSMEHVDLKPTDFNTSQQVQKEESSKKPSKRPKKGLRDAIKSSASDGNQEIKQCIHSHPSIAKENQPEESKGKISTDPVYFEMTPFESNQQPSQSNSDCYVQLKNEVKDVISTVPVSDEVFPFDADSSNHSSISVSGLRSSARRVKPRRADNQRRKCRVLQRRTRKGEGVTSSITMEDADLATASSHLAGNGLSRRLSRSYSCPEIPSLRPHDTPWACSLYSPHHSRIHTPHQSSHTPSLHHAHKSLRRARRHTVCSVEVEREIAPLCLRKEVYPSRRSLPYDRASLHLSPSLALSPSTSLTALASCFLSSPLAFLSKKVESRRSAASPSTSSHVSSPTSSSPIYPMIFLERIDSSNATLDYSSSGNPLDCEIERRRQSEEEDDGEDTSSSSQEFEDVGLREEKALSDSEIKVVQKLEERGKVSSIRIRKTLPKPQNNLTPMGLPKPIRLKKKEFSLEEIYTNKNFSKPPESRLETIFEVPLNRRNGSESWFGQRRLKRFLEFLDAGEVRKPKKPLVGVGKAGISSSRTRRGGFPKDESPLSVQDVDSLLCAKLDQLSRWLIDDQKDS